MTTTRTLAEQVGPLPDGIETLSDEHKQLLADAVRDARRAQAATLQTAAEDALKHVPFVIRPAVRKAVGL
ncbi:hypothetical protein BJF85_20455 [Saccharomonospora sp. CUA-673]|uniref:hypothetical protein n=1 Tax=Saccharomonospora sp. CUA-673 TaxID=1904969 RepID=UPI000964F2E0|nr:hypothetical protein [Saccharomonospora sp. CUA-673]OLT44089.1 hypothetical protein BJF85_20455 [Saccharomonospora sp. CUA-673]